MSSSLENKKERLLLYQCIQVFVYVVLLAGYGGLDTGLVAVCVQEGCETSLDCGVVEGSQVTAGYWLLNSSIFLILLPSCHQVKRLPLPHTPDVKRWPPQPKETKPGTWNRLKPLNRRRQRSISPWLFQAFLQSGGNLMCGANNIDLTVTMNMSFYIFTVLYLYWFHVSVSFTDLPSPEGELASVLSLQPPPPPSLLPTGAPAKSCRAAGQRGLSRALPGQEPRVFPALSGIFHRDFHKDNNEELFLIFYKSLMWNTVISSKALQSK